MDRQHSDSQLVKLIDQITENVNQTILDDIQDQIDDDFVAALDEQ